MPPSPDELAVLATRSASGRIRSMSVYKINANDINDDATATFTVT